MATFKAVILKGDIHVKSDGTTNLKIRITHNKKSEYISTDIFVVPDKTKRGYSLGSNADYITDRITDYISKYQKAYLKLGDTSRSLSVKELKQAIMNDDNKEIDFLKFADHYIAELEANGQQGSLRAVRGFVSKLKRFTTSLTFSQIDSRFLENFERFMLKDGVGNSISTYMSRFRVIFNKGREHYNDEDRGIIKIKNYPFKKYKIEQPESRSKDNCLSVEQLRMFIQSKPINDTKRITHRAEIAKDVFMLMIYLIGPNSKDLFFAENPVKGRWKYDRFKTGRPYGIKLETEAMEIIEHYAGKNGLLNFQERFEDYLYFQKYINNGLRDICISMHEEFIKNRTDIQKRKKVELDFPQKITTNWARHTWATIARNRYPEGCNIDKDDVALCLGHEDEDNVVTDMYIKYDYSIIDTSNRKVIDFIKPKNTIIEKNYIQKEDFII